MKELKAYLLWLKPEEHTKAKMIAAKQHKTLGEYMAEAVHEKNRGGQSG